MVIRVVGMNLMGRIANPVAIGVDPGVAAPVVAGAVIVPGGDAVVIDRFEIRQVTAFVN